MKLQRLARNAAHGVRLRGRSIVVALVLAISGVAAAADIADAPQTTSAVVKVATAKTRAAERLHAGTLVVFNRPVVTFRAEFMGISPDQRADNANQRVYAALDRGGPGKVSVEDIPQGKVIKVDGALAFVLTAGDVDPLLGQTLDSLTQDAAQALTRAIGETQEARSGRRMLANLLWAGGATIVYLLVLWLLRHLGDFVTRRMVALAEATAGQIKIGGAEILQRERTIRVVARALRVGFWGFVLLVTYEWIGFVLSRFPFTRPWGEQLNTFLIDTATGMLGAIAGAVPNLLVVAVVFVIASWFNGLLGSFFDGVQSGRVSVSWLDADSARPTRRLATIAVWVFALVMAYPYIPGSDSDAFKGLSVLIGLMVSVGASGHRRPGGERDDPHVHADVSSRRIRPHRRPRRNARRDGHVHDRGSAPEWARSSRCRTRSFCRR